ncbi:hypothetical protein SDC9_91974 [bioreactor metagenome]|uniref:Uncharacterized protein n=1 Tax=bioreactor metagenome TaxID=1076179 RepID=A0A644ZXZ1_9ZZZZ
MNFSQGGFFVYFYKLLIDALSLHLHDALAQVCRREVHRLHIVLDNRKLNVRVHKGNTFNFREDIPSFGLVRFQELATGRHIKEYVFYRDCSSHSAKDGFLAFYLRSGNLQPCPHFILRTPGFKFYVRDSRYGCECFTTKTPGVQGKEIFGGFNL